MTYYFLLGLQFFSVCGLIFIAGLILKNSRNRIHSYLFFYCIATLVNSAGYLGMMLSKTQESAILCQQIGYLGRSWVPYALILFVSSYCGFEDKIKGYVHAVLIFIHFTTYILVMTSDLQPLYYVGRTFVTDGLFPHLKYGYGAWHILYNVMVLVYAVAVFYMLRSKYRVEKDVMGRKGMLLITGALAINLLFFVLEIVGVGEAYDMIQLGYAASIIFLYFALTRFDILDTRKLARDFVVDRLSEAIIAVDGAGKVGFFNASAVRLFPGLEHDPDTVKNEIEALADKGELFEKDGRKYHPNINELLRNGRPAGTAYVFSDETERIEHMEQLSEQKRLADRANKAKTEFLTHMSHDIRTPINAVLGMDEMILRESREEAILSYAVNIKNAGKTLLMLINDILDISKIEEGKMEMIRAEYEFTEMAGDIVNIISESAKEKGLEFDLKISENVPKVLVGDSMRIKQCLLNLLNNSVKYTDRGKISLEVGCRRTDEGKAVLSFTVSDTGVGIKPEDMDRIFLPFVRFDEEQHRYIEGTGLGMNIVKNLLDLMGSDLKVSSEYGKGSVFSFEIEQDIVNGDPIGSISDLFAAYEKEQRIYNESFRAPDARIMVVDDNRVNLMVITNLLKKTEIRVDTAMSGRQAIEMFNENSYDCVFIDHMMPEMDGIETLNEMKKAGGADKTVFIVLTANAIAGAKEMYLSAGFEDYLSKPVNAAELEKMLVERLPQEKLLPGYAPEEE